ncbi:hypothetical protein [Yersinia ruckeri]|uniref:Uncharacterized protein n=1 Tax=Yersinia ruckeri TaxID=29486 RepID=A0A085U327_YERRU|nr:hypothetical protein [Yersinia ruckeri]AKA38458.1 hypothetical protein UGYR_08630 [Yersinia ruckeri]ARY99656.1 hypothetical protein QMA0440_00288 [Yersinia ruckeri]AUQ41791.1 hypothetical protein NJ56_07630 [Yersinia ruckeri]EEP98497.1 hypothetical protein yruck0001_1760 [Yersinia ruckeri ATCC 29473]EKN4182672.1 hypothetical protein [Yersinia ruckeri]
MRVSIFKAFNLTPLAKSEKTSATKLSGSRMGEKLASVRNSNTGMGRAAGLHMKANLNNQKHVRFADTPTLAKSLASAPKAQVPASPEKMVKFGELRFNPAKALSQLKMAETPMQKAIASRLMNALKAQG